jgi:hypothetical protein
VNKAPPVPGSKHIFDEVVIKALVLDWQEDKSEATFEKILQLIDGMVHAIVYTRGIHRYEDMDEIMQKLRIKIWRVLDMFDVERGSIHNFLTIVVHNTLGHINTELINRAARFCSTESLNGERSILDRTPAPETDTSPTDDLTYRLMQVRTTRHDPQELEAQRWLVKSFIDAGFLIRRYEAANAMTKVYGIPGDRSRQLYDETLVEIRRQVIEFIKIPKAGKMRGTRQKPLAPLRDSMSEERFDKLVFLLRGIAPSVRLCTLEIIDGYRLARPLFENEYVANIQVQ